MAKHNIETIAGSAPYIGIDLSIAKIKSDTKFVVNPNCIAEIHLHKDGNKYLELSSNEESSFTIEDYTYPFDFKLCS